MRGVFSILLLFATCANAQFTVHLKIFSVADSLPVDNIALILDYRGMIKTDSTGLATINSKINQARITYQMDGVVKFDTILSIRKGNDTVSLYVPFNFDSELARQDIARNNMQFYCGSGVIVAMYSATDKEFEKTFNIQYEIMGCTPTMSSEKSVAYNRTIASYLDKKYGRYWRQKVRRDVHGVTYRW